MLKSVHHVPEHLSTMSPDCTPQRGEGENRSSALTRRKPVRCPNVEHHSLPSPLPSPQRGEGENRSAALTLSAIYSPHPGLYTPKGRGGKPVRCLNEEKTGPLPNVEHHSLPSPLWGEGQGEGQGKAPRFTCPPRSATMPALKVRDLPLPRHLVRADLTCHQNE